MNIVFFGSTDFSLPILKRVYEVFGVSGVVITKPRPKGRGRKTTFPQVVEWAKRLGLTTYMPEDPNDEAFVNELRKTTPDLFVLSAYGHILNKTLLATARLGGINIHPSLLPRYRGAAPIQRAIMAGEEKTGITVFFMDEKVDHGEIVARREIPIEKDDTYGSLADRLANLGAEMIIDILEKISSGNSKRNKQHEGEASYAPKIKKQELYINWEQDAERVYNLIRALLPRPGARTYFRRRELLIMWARLGDKRLSPGSLSVQEKQLYVGAGNGSLELLEVKPEGRKAMSARDFINGYRIQEGEVLG